MVCAVGVLGAWLTIGWLVSFSTGKEIAESGSIAFAVLWVGCLVGLITSWATGLQSRGSQLVDCGGHPTRWLFLANAVFFAFAGTAGGFSSSTFGTWGALFAFSFSAYWVLMGTGRLGVYENGIWTYWGLVKWTRIGAFSWADDDTLLVRGTGFLSFLWRSAIPVPRERVAAVKEQLLSHLPAASTA
ncbi:unnamed protein product [Ectocarpus sp. 4 AP-2014]